MGETLFFRATLNVYSFTLKDKPEIQVLSSLTHTLVTRAKEGKNYFYLSSRVI